MEHQLRILVVDGSRTARRLIGQTLTREVATSTLEITAVGSGAEALEALAGDRFDLISSAQLLPDTLGVDLCRLIRSVEGYRFTPFVLATAEAEARAQEQAAAGVTAVFGKNDNLTGLVEFVRRLAGRNQQLHGKVLFLSATERDYDVIGAVMVAQGLSVVRGESTEQALGLLTPDLDLVVLDLQPRGALSAHEFLHALRFGFGHAREALPVLVLAADGSERVQAEVFHAGANDFLVKPVIPDMLLGRMRSLLLQRRRHLAARAPPRADGGRETLLQIHNRRYLLEQATLGFPEVRSYPVSLAMVDLDDFNAVNDQYGRAAGDALLGHIAALLRQFFRKADLVARTGGKEFSVLMRKRTREGTPEEVEGLARRVEDLRDRIAAIEISGARVTASIGVSSNICRAGMELDEVLEEADQARYQAKDLGRNRVVFRHPLVEAGAPLQ